MENREFFKKPLHVFLLAMLCCTLWGSAAPFIKTKPVDNHKKKHHPSGWCFFRVLRGAPFIAVSRAAASNKKRYPLRTGGVSFSREASAVVSVRWRR